MDTGDDPKPNILDVSDRYQARTPCLSRAGRRSRVRRVEGVCEAADDRGTR